MATLLAVSSSKIVRMTSAAIRNSSDSKSARPSSFLYPGYGSGTRFNNCRRNRTEPKMIETTMMTTARSCTPCDDNSIHSRTLLTPYPCSVALLGPPAAAAEQKSVSADEPAPAPTLRQDVKGRLDFVSGSVANSRKASEYFPSFWRIWGQECGHNCHI